MELVMKFVGVICDKSGRVFESDFDTGSGPMVGPARYWYFCTDQIEEETATLVCLVRTDRLYTCERPEIIVDSKWSDSRD
jgi:hypothetical protein